MQKDILRYGDIKSLLIKYSIPSIIGMLVSALYNIVDRAFIGQIKDIGGNALTGVGVTLPITTIMLAFAMLIGIGATANISIKLGERRKDEAESIIGTSISLSIIVGILLTIIIFIFRGKMLYLFGATDTTYIYAKEYLDIILLGTVFSVLGYVLSSTIRADGSPKIASTIMVLSCLINAVLDPILIFKFNMGIKGASCATVFSQFVTFLLSIIYYLSSKSYLKIRKRDLKIDKRYLKTILVVGISPFLMQLATSLVQVVNNNVLKKYGGDNAIGAMVIISGISLMCLMPVFGISQGAQPIIGYNYGAKLYDRVKKSYNIALYVSVAIFTLALVVIQLYPKELIYLFNSNNPEIVKTAISGIRIYLIAMPTIALGMVGANYFLSIGDGKTAMILSLLRQVILLVPLVIVLPIYMGLDGVWLAQPISDITAGIITYIVVRLKFKKLQQ